jgi:hypothetical protein
MVFKRIPIIPLLALRKTFSEFGGVFFMTFFLTVFHFSGKQESAPMSGRPTDPIKAFCQIDETSLRLLEIAIDKFEYRKDAL